jgi:hypothetical protein
MELLCAELLKYFPKNSFRGFIVGLGIGFFTLSLLENSEVDSHLLSHKMAGLFSLFYVSVSMRIFTLKQALEITKNQKQAREITKNQSQESQGFLSSALSAAKVTIILVSFVQLLFFINSKMLNLTYYQSDKAVFFASIINHLLDIGDTPDSYFMGFMFCYGFICFLLCGFIETIYDSGYQIKSKISK